MTVKEYLDQAYRLDQRINSDLEEASGLRNLALSISSLQMTERVQTSPKGEAPFAERLEKVMLLEEKINTEIDLLIDLKEQIGEVIQAVPDINERMVLRYRYLHSMNWGQIGNDLQVDARTVRRWHDHALEHAVLPENPIKV